MLGHITILLSCQLIGEMVVTASGLPLPGPVVGMVLLFSALVLRGGEVGPLADTARGLLSHLGLLFVPAGVGISVHLALLQRDGVAIGVALVVSTVVTIAVTALSFVWLDRINRR
jgi:holin-like protein